MNATLAKAKNLTQLVQVGRNSHELHVYDAARRAGIAGPGQPWSVARRALSVARVEIVASLKGHDNWDSSAYGHDYEQRGGSWAAFARSIPAV